MFLSSSSSSVVESDKNWNRDIWSSVKVSGVYIVRTDRLCGLVVRVPGYRSRGPGFDSRFSES
jgi:hypothetical protein